MFFTVEPSAYHDITSLDGEEETQTIEAMPFRVAHPPATSKKRPKKASARPKTVKKRKSEEASDGSVSDEAYTPTPSLRAITRALTERKKSRLPGGTSRSRRMVLNNVTVQSAYMCL